ncbi:MAG TPA: Bax inhibitor-1 family protein [Solirubrobacteraceae bacterium]|nr:Bax inhibitor-1 family protein [Solirubrobacteraceae bacterium]
MPSYTRSYAATTPGRALSQDESKAVLGQTMGLVALTLGFLALGAYLTRNVAGGSSFLFFIGGFACIFGLQFAAARGHEQLAIALLFGLGLLLGMFVGPVLAYYAKSDPAPLWQAAGATGGFVLATGSYGYATRRDLSSWARGLFWALIALIVFGLITLFVAIPGGNIIYCLAGLVIFGGFTILDFNRLRRTNLASAPMLAASIFLDIFNVFLFFLSLFGGNGRR